MITHQQVELLAFLDTYPGWHTILEIDSLKMLSDDVVVVIPSLVEDGLIMYLAAIRSVAITRKGEDVARAFR